MMSEADHVAQHMRVVGSLFCEEQREHHRDAPARLRLVPTPAPFLPNGCDVCPVSEPDADGNCDLIEVDWCPVHGRSAA